MRLADLKRHQPRVLRATLRELADKHISVLEKVLEAEHPANLIDPKLAELQMTAWQAAAKYGLGTNQNLTTGDDEDQPVGGIVALPALAMEQLQGGDSTPVRAFLPPLSPAQDVANVASGATDGAYDRRDVSTFTGEYEDEPAGDVTSVASRGWDDQTPPILHAPRCTQCTAQLTDPRMRQQAEEGKPAFCSVQCAVAYIG